MGIELFGRKPHPKAHDSTNCDARIMKTKLRKRMKETKKKKEDLNGNF